MKKIQGGGGVENGHEAWCAGSPVLTKSDRMVPKLTAALALVGPGRAGPNVLLDHPPELATTKTKPTVQT